MFLKLFFLLAVAAVAIYAAPISTACGKVPTIANGQANTDITVNYAPNNKTVKSRFFVVTFTCNEGFHFDAADAANTIQTCNSTKPKPWKAVPKCKKDQQQGDTAVTKPKVTKATTTKRVVTAKTTTRKATTTKKQAATTKLTTAALLQQQTTKQPVAVGGNLKGGSTGPQCFPGVAATHASCHPNGANLVKTVPISVDEVLNAHNKVRREVQPRPKTPLVPLQWDNQLAIEAERWAATCKGGHDSYDARALPPKFQYVGQNFFKGSGKEYTFVDAVDLWAAEREIWEYGKGKTGNKPPLLTAVGHFTQLVWASTTHVGCGKAVCQDGQYLCCNYGPAGNLVMAGQNPYSNPYEI